MNLNKLNYPMFKITLNEAFLLVEANKHLGAGEKLLCCALNMARFEYQKERKAILKLKQKISIAIRGKSFLSRYMNENGDLSSFDYIPHKLRKVRVKKLLAHNGY